MRTYFATRSIVVHLFLVVGADAALQTTAQIYGKVSLESTAVDSSEAAGVYSQCFYGIGLSTCHAAAVPPDDDALPNYLAISYGSPWCLDCCGRGDSTYIWPVKCGLTAYTATSVNLYSSEFRIARMQTLTDTNVLRCSIRRSQCSYDSEGILVSCATKTLYLAGYTLTLTIKEHYKHFAYWNEVLACDVSSNETTYKPSEFHETVVMNYYIPDTSYTDNLTLLIILVGSAAFVFVCLRFIRREQCIVCGKRLMFTCFRCAYCRFYGAEAPCPEMLAELQNKSRVLVGHQEIFRFSPAGLPIAKAYISSHAYDDQLNSHTDFEAKQQDGASSLQLDAPKQMKERKMNIVRSIKGRNTSMLDSLVIMMQTALHFHNEAIEQHRETPAVDTVRNKYLPNWERQSNEHFAAWAKREDIAEGPRAKMVGRRKNIYNVSPLVLTDAKIAPAADKPEDEIPQS